MIARLAAVLSVAILLTFPAGFARAQFTDDLILSEYKLDANGNFNGALLGRQGMTDATEATFVTLTVSVPFTPVAGHRVTPTTVTLTEPATPGDTDVNTNSDSIKTSFIASPIGLDITVDMASDPSVFIFVGTLVPETNDVLDLTQYFFPDWFILDPNGVPTNTLKDKTVLPPLRIQAFSDVPEPSTLSVLGIGTVGLLGFAWRRRKKVV